MNKSQTAYSPHQARKRFGQNFLSDDRVIERIIQSIAPRPEDTLIEIGPGPGALTRHLLTACPSMIAIELDRDLANHLRATLPTLNLIEGDVLKTDIASLCSPAHKRGRIKIVGNLPYNISTPLLFKLLEEIPHTADMYFMLQKEVVDRLEAVPSTKTYGRLSVMMQYACCPQSLFTIPPHAFSPAPKVQSAFVVLQPRAKKLPVINFSLFKKIVAAAFQQRRKTLRNALHAFLPASPASQVSDYMGRRAETLSVEEFVKLSNLLSEQQQGE
jgi:16S rRNA (adenine1518-N6/adenine1519-N6)-dimethyltransferase